MIPRNFEIPKPKSCKNVDDVWFFLGNFTQSSRRLFSSPKSTNINQPSRFSQFLRLISIIPRLNHSVCPWLLLSKLCLWRHSTHLLKDPRWLVPRYSCWIGRTRGWSWQKVQSFQWHAAVTKGNKGLWWLFVTILGWFLQCLLPSFWKTNT